MPQYPFGSGALWVERTDTTGNLIGPVQVGVLQDCSVSYDSTLKELRGQLQFPDDIAIGERKVTASAKFGRLFGALFADIVFGSTDATTGVNTVAYNEAQSVPANPGPYTVTVTHSATWVLDLGVYFTTTGVRMTRVTSLTATGQYQVASGVYTFDSADQGVAVKINYMYTLTSGFIATLTNQFQGVTPTFKATFYTNRTGINVNSLVWTLNSCVCSKLTLPSRMGEYEIMQLDFQAFADSSGTVGTISSTE